MVKDLGLARRLLGADGLDLLRTDWIPVARSDELDGAGAFRAVTFLRQPVLLARAADGVVRAFANVCRHRHATVAEGEGRASRFTCPYHAWSYGLDGRFLSASCFRDELGPAEGLALGEYAAIEWQGWVMVCLEGRPPEPADRAPALDAALTERGVADWRVARTIDYPSPWNWSIMVENFSESYHHLAVHRTTLQPRWPAAQTYGVDTGGEYSELRHPVDDVDGTFTVFTLFPLLAFAVQSPAPVAFWPMIVPVDVGRFDLRMHVLAHHSLLDDGPLLDGLASAIDTIHREDIPVMERVSRGSRSDRALPPNLISVEQPLRLFHEYVSRRFAEMAGSDGA